MRKPIIAGNWKMNKTVPEALELVNGIKNVLRDIKEVEIVVCPPATGLSEVAGVLQGSNIGLGAQNVYWEEGGAYTGEISCLMLKEIGCRYVIIGHSERRSYFNETNESVNKKVKTVLRYNLTPIVCVGERLEQREANQTFEVVRDHIQGALQGFSAEEAKKIIIAYEPVWAIGTGRTATPDQAQEVHGFIRQLLKELHNHDVADIVRIQYGGSIKPDNIIDLMAQPDVDGGLVGGASLKLDSFVKIVKGSRK